MTTENLAASLFREEVLALSAYKVADARGLVKLDAMENPYSWPEAIKTEWLNCLRDSPINRYPDPEAKQLTATLKRQNQITGDVALLLGNGSDEIIQMLLMALPPSASVLAPVPCFVMYKQISDCLGLNYIPVPLLADSFELDLPIMLAAIARYQPSLIFIAYPNNPTGNLFSEQAIITLLETSKGLVVIDEAYAPFAQASFMDRLADYPNLLVMRTVSKLGLAGLRLGYLAGPSDIIRQLDKIRLPYNINCLTQLSVVFALSEQSLFDQQTATICAERQRLFDQLNNFADIHAYPSAANFILFKTADGQADRLFELIKQHGVLIKNLNPQSGLLKNCLRVTVGTVEENNAFLSALGNALAR